MGLFFSDYNRLSFITTESEYIIGTNSGKEFTSVSTLLYATQDCQIRLNDDSHWATLRGGILYEMDRKIWKITAKRVSTNGDLDIFAEGNKLR